MKTSELIGMLIASIAANGDLPLVTGPEWDDEDVSALDILEIKKVDGLYHPLAKLVKE